MVRWVEIDRQVLAAAVECIYRYYHLVCNAGSRRSRLVIGLRRENDITSQRGGRMIKTLLLLAKLFPNCPFWKKTSSHQVWCQILFKNRFWETVMSSLLQTHRTSSFYRNLFIFWQAVYKLCKPPVFTQYQPNTPNESSSVETGRKETVPLITDWTISVWGRQKFSDYTLQKEKSARHGLLVLLS